MSALTAAVISGPIIAILSCIIDDCLEWRKDISIKLMLFKTMSYMLIFAAVPYPFSISLAKDGFSYEMLTVAYILGFGCLFPVSGQLIRLLYRKIMREGSD